MSGWIGVDLDGTLAHYTKWESFEHVGEPIKPMVERVKKWLSSGREVRIFTARCFGYSSDTGAFTLPIPEAIAAVNRFCFEQFGQHLPITNIKDIGMVELWDDRAVQVRINTGEPVGFSTNEL